MGPYEIVSPLGAGGMGEVYRAHDTKLGREVAIKILPDLFAQDAERVARFEREARMLAALNHPNIAQIYGIEEAARSADSGQASVRALVMELVEGEDLAERLARGAVPIDEALPIARQLADAIEAAHEQGVIHRDLKPANIKVREDGTVKVLDFGLAKAMDPTAASGAGNAMANSPTLTAHATQMGIIIGTAAYMAPEQARGKLVDRRADIWSFGVVLTELLTGERAFRGEDVTEVLAKVIEREPDLSHLPTATPSSLRRLIARCLVKDPKQRLRDMGEARIAIGEAEREFAQGPSSGSANTAPMPVSMAPMWRRTLPWAAASLLLAAITGFVVWTLRPAEVRPVVRLALPLPPGDHVSALMNRAVALSPDGSRVAFVSEREEGKGKIYLRAFDSSESKAIPGTEQADSLFFSPDGKWIGFGANGKLMRVAVIGGVPFQICKAINLRGASWGSNGTIVFASGFGVSGLSQVSETGGTPKRIVSKESTAGYEADRWPELLPGGKAVLFTAWTRKLEDARIVVERLDTHERREIIRGGTSPRYVPSGHIVYYARAGVLMAVPFDLARLERTGDPVQVAEGVALEAEGVAQFDISGSGSLVYLSGNAEGPARKMVWVDRHGAQQPLAAPTRNYQVPRLSPNGRQVTVAIRGSENDDIWIWDFPNGASLIPLTFGARSDSPQWTPDGGRIVYRSTRNGIFHLFSKLANGGGDETQLTTGERGQGPATVSPDGQILFTDNSDLWLLPAAGAGNPHILFPKPSSGHQGFFSLSRDGRWLSYVSDEVFGHAQTFIRSFPDGKDKRQVSIEGGGPAVWAQTGPEQLYYLNDDKMMAVGLTTRPLTVGTPRELFRGSYLPGFDVSRDGQHFLMLVASEEQAPTSVNVVLNWFEILKRVK